MEIIALEIANVPKGDFGIGGEETNNEQPRPQVFKS
jgi:hypothetical protein